MFVFKAGVLGAGTMGGEIAFTIADVGVPVVLKDVEEELVEAGIAKARSLWQARVEKGRMSEEDREARLALITGTTAYDAFSDADFVVEAVPERMELKQAVFAELDAATPGHAILASNTSSLPISEMAEATSRPDRVVGFHYFYPASTMRLVEIVEGEHTSAETAQAAANFAQTLRKMPIRCTEDPGFVVNRILNSAFGEVFRFQEENDIPVEEIDRALGDAKAVPMGPFRLVDMLGLDTVVHVGRHLNEVYGDRFPLHRGMQELVEQGHLGVKTRKGFYEHGQ